MNIPVVGEERKRQRRRESTKVGKLAVLDAEKLSRVCVATKENDSRESEEPIKA